MVTKSILVAFLEILFWEPRDGKWSSIWLSKKDFQKGHEDTFSRRRGRSIHCKTIICIWKVFFRCQRFYWYGNNWYQTRQSDSKYRKRIFIDFQNMMPRWRRWWKNNKINDLLKFQLPATHMVACKNIARKWYFLKPF